MFIVKYLFLMVMMMFGSTALSAENPQLFTALSNGSWTVRTLKYHIIDIAVTDMAAWAITRPNSVARLERNTSVITYDERSFATNWLTEIDAYDEDSVYLVEGRSNFSPAMLYLFNGDEWEHVASGDINDGRLHSLAVDRIGNAWYYVGAYSGDGSIRRYNHQTGKVNKVTTLETDVIFFSSDDTVWMGGGRLAYSKPLLLDDGKKIYTHFDFLELPEDYRSFNALAETSEGDILLGSRYTGRYYGIARYDGEDWINYTSKDGLLNSIVYEIDVDKHGCWWISTERGIAYFDGTSWSNITTANSPLKQNNENKIDIDENGVVWIGSSTKLISFTYDDSVAVEESEIPSQFSLDNVFPNPFNPSTTIAFTLDKPGNVTLSIYNVSGQKIHEIENGYKPVGNYCAVWNGLNENGESVSSGVYFAVLSGGGRMTAKRMLLLK